MYPLETRELAVEAVAAGFSLTEAAELAGCSRTAVVNWAKAAGVAPPPRKKAVYLPFDRKMELVARLEAGERAADLAAEAGVTAAAVSGWRRRLREEGALSLMTDSDIAARAPEPREAPSELEELRARCEELELRNAVLEGTIDILKKDPGADLSALTAAERAALADRLRGRFGLRAALAALSRAVVEEEADLGVMFDADGDRVAIVDQTGRAINRNRLIALIAAILLDDEKDLTFVTDSVTSSGLSRFITEWGGTHYRYRRGYKNVIEEAKRLSAEGIHVPVAIETSGHAAMAENYFIDDGMYLATKVICEAMWRKRDGLTLSSLIDELQEPAESVEVRLPIIQEDYRRAAGYVIEAILSNTLTNPEWRLAPDNREGVRILFSLDGGVDNAWFMLRLSVHDPVMPVNAESDVEGGLEYILTQLYAVLEKDNEELDLTPLKDVINQLKTK